MRIALDSNLLVYLARVWKVEADREKTGRLDSFISNLSDVVRVIVPYQSLGEAYRVMFRSGYERERCRDILLDWVNAFEPVASSNDAFTSAIDLATDHKLQFWDALIVNVAAEANCTLLLSEDLQPGFRWRGVTVINPLTAEMDERLVRLMSNAL